MKYLKQIKNRLICFFALLSICACHKKKPFFSTARGDDINQIQMTGTLQSTEVFYITAPVSGPIKNSVEDGSTLKKNDFIADITPQIVNEEALNQKQSLDQLLQDKSSRIEEVQTTIQNNMTTINKAQADIDIFQKTRANKNVNELAQFIPLNDLKKEEIDNRANLATIEQLSLQNTILEKQINLYKTNFDERITLLQKKLAENENKKDSIVKSSGDGMIFFLKNWQGDKFIKGSFVYNGFSFARVENRKKMHVVCYLPEEDRSKALLGKGVSVIVFGAQNQEVSGTIHSISEIVMPLKSWDSDLAKGKESSLDPLFFQMIVSIEDISADLKPGTKVQVSL